VATNCVTDLNPFIFVKGKIMLPTPERIKNYIASGLECTHLEVEGDGQHFSALIVSPAFAGKRLIQRHQIVYAALGDRMREEIHALSMKTLTPEEHQP
jgi:acid stress-induced BolA-like protein IbaG/YrbA